MLGEARRCIGCFCIFSEYLKFNHVNNRYFFIVCTWIPGHSKLSPSFSTVVVADVVATIVHKQHIYAIFNNLFCGFY